MIYALGCILIFAVLLFVDLITKAFAHAANVQQSDYFIGLFKLNYQKNSGMMLSIFDKNHTAMIVVTILTVIMIIGIAVLFFTVFKHNKPAQMTLAIIEAGAIGNLADRLCLGFVRDFLNVNKILFFPNYTCNIADIYILFGAIALIFIIMFIGKHAVFPLTKKWREEAKIEEAKKEKARKRNK